MKQMLKPRALLGFEADLLLSSLLGSGRGALFHAWRHWEVLTIEAGCLAVVGELETPPGKVCWEFRAS